MRIRDEEECNRRKVAILQVLEKAATHSSACPSNAEIANQTNMTLDQARRMIDELITEEQVVRETIGGGARRLEMTRSGNSTGWTNTSKRDGLYRLPRQKGRAPVKCLGEDCGKTFLSPDRKRIRICPTCKTKEGWLYGEAAMHYEEVT